MAAPQPLPWRRPPSPAAVLVTAQGYSTGQCGMSDGNDYELYSCDEPRWPMSDYSKMDRRWVLAALPRQPQPLACSLRPGTCTVQAAPATA